VSVGGRSGVGDRLGRIGGVVKTGREWISMGRRSSWEGEQWIVAQEKESEVDKNRDEKIVIVKLIVQKENRNKNKIKPTIM
jgi:hypothetical protein